MKKINRKDIGKLLDQWSQQFTVFVPSQENGTTAMAEWDKKDTGFLDWYRNTVVSAKANFFPPAEPMLSFKKNKEGYKIELPPANGKKQLIFGIRPCDARAMPGLDINFKDTYEDPYYLSRRNNTLLVGLGCNNPYDSCFCTSLNINPTESKDVDLMLTETGSELLIEAVTKAGEELLAKTQGLTETTKADETVARKTKEAANNKIKRKLDVRNIDKKLLANFDNKAFWEEIAAKCVSCGICTLLCPTCFCFDINDEMVKNEGTRFRSRDSCAFPIYTRMPMENPRDEKWQRVRQKVCHKFEFQPMNFNFIGCVGCGRCIRLCPVNWDITQTLSSLPTKGES